MESNSTILLTHVGNNSVTLEQSSVQIEKATHNIYNIFREKAAISPTIENQTSNNWKLGECVR